MAAASREHRESTQPNRTRSPEAAACHAQKIESSSQLFRNLVPRAGVAICVGLDRKSRRSAIRFYKSGINIRRKLRRREATDCTGGVEKGLPNRSFQERPILISNAIARFPDEKNKNRHQPHHDEHPVLALESQKIEFLN
ncbi:hypothetical protein [Bradyrhizobium canariense]|uniref:hypothetical protein n=1 Tax=Bradyrhizobium canariense TaxID=255045 RepID=UPI0011BA7EFA|nr:hypothetical protein [Bradyrhizobium canariense]